MHDMFNTEYKKSPKMKGVPFPSESIPIDPKNIFYVDFFSSTYPKVNDFTYY